MERIIYSTFAGLNDRVCHFIKFYIEINNIGLNTKMLETATEGGKYQYITYEPKFEAWKGHFERDLTMRANIRADRRTDIIVLEFRDFLDKLHES